jgi:hypothetical protein
VKAGAANGFAAMNWALEKKQSTQSEPGKAHYERFNRKKQEDDHDRQQQN